MVENGSKIGIFCHTCFNSFFSLQLPLPPPAILPTNEPAFFVIFRIFSSSYEPPKKKSIFRRKNRSKFENFLDLRGGVILRNLRKINGNAILDRFSQCENSEMLVISGKIRLFSQCENCEMSRISGEIRVFSQCENCEMSASWTNFWDFGLHTRVGP